MYIIIIIMPQGLTSAFFNVHVSHENGGRKLVAKLMTKLERARDIITKRNNGFADSLSVVVSASVVGRVHMRLYANGRINVLGGYRVATLRREATALLARFGAKLARGSTVIGLSNWSGHLGRTVVDLDHHVDVLKTREGFADVRYNSGVHAALRFRLVDEDVRVHVFASGAVAVMGKRELKQAQRVVIIARLDDAMIDTSTV